MNALLNTAPPSSASILKQKTQTLVVKIGTESFSQPDGLPRAEVLEPLAQQLVALREAGHRLLLVSSGAVGLGRHRLGWAKPLSEAQKGVAAMVGQSMMIQVYSELFGHHGFLPAAQGLLQNANLYEDNDPHSPRAIMLDRLNAAFKVPRLIPVLNENDFVSGAEIMPFDPADPDTYSDNDGLSSLIARIVHADQMVAISTHSVYTLPPTLPNSKPVPFINFASPDFNPEKLGISTQGASSGGTGGMEVKLEKHRDFVQAAGLCGQRTAHIISYTSIAQNGLIRALSGEDVGTRLVCCVPAAVRVWRRENLPDPACCKYDF